jgi:hypothetical protein|nr:hypothetical protein [Oxalobacteraceae bacterium]
MIIREGGNVFKDPKGQPLTQRIDRADVPATVAFIEKVLGQTFPPDTWLGSTGKAATSGDMDLAVDSNQVTKDDIAAAITSWAQKNKLDPRQYVVKRGEVHFRTPIRGDANRGFVQTDFMFFPNVEWGKFFYSGGEDSAFKGAFRNILMSSLAKAQGLKVGANGMFSRTTNQLVDGGLEPDHVAQVLLGPGKKRDALKNVETIYANLRQDPDRDAKLADFRDHLAKNGMQEPQLKENEVNFLARLRDRLVNQGMYTLIEQARPILEEEPAGVGGRAKGIEHLEDLVFRRGTAGVRQALDIVKHVAKDPKSTTVKWDGKPAVIFGRKPATGEFVLTDGSGFDAKTYDGLATSPEMMAQIQNTRGQGREDLINIYATLWPMLEQALPSNFRGYVKGDLLYMQTPPIQQGNYVFRPNTVEYRIPAKSTLGQRIGASEVGIAMHSMYADQGEPRQALSRVKFNPVPGLLLLEPIVSKGVTPDQDLMREISGVVKAHGRDIDTLFNPAELRAQQITDLAKLCVDFINHKIGSGSFDNLLPEFGVWLQQKVTPRKFNNIIEYLKNPTSNQQGMAAAFTLFLLLHDLKLDLLRQLDLQSPGNEGWVMATPAGYAKAVNRFDFTVRNRARNNP